MPILQAEPQSFPTDLLSGAQDPADRLWWVVQTKSRQEKSLARDLMTRNIAFYLPQVRQTAIVRGRRQTSFIPLFTGYLFLFGNEIERNTSLSLPTNRIANVLPVHDAAELERDLQQISLLIENNSPLTVEGRLKAGDRVRVKKGALAGVEGTVIDRRGKCRLLVAVHLLQQGVSMEVDDFLLEPI